MNPTLSADDTIGPRLTPLPLTPVQVRLPPGWVAPLIEPDFIASQHKIPISWASPASQEALPAPSRPVSARLSGLVSVAAAEIIKPLAIGQASRSSVLLCLGLAAFMVWAGYAAVPGMTEALPANSWRGAGYLAVLVPASVFASCVFMALGRGLGYMAERAVLSLSMRRLPQDKNSSQPSDY